jgi:hypothetical protein
MTPFEERDDQITKMIRREIEQVAFMAKRCGWTPKDSAWNYAFGEIAGMHRILRLIDPDADQMRPEKREDK